MMYSTRYNCTKVYISITLLICQIPSTWMFEKSAMRICVTQLPLFNINFSCSLRIIFISTHFRIIFSVNYSAYILSDKYVVYAYDGINSKFKIAAGRQQYTAETGIFETSRWCQEFARRQDICICAEYPYKTYKQYFYNILLSRDVTALQSWTVKATYSDPIPENNWIVKKRGFIIIDIAAREELLKMRLGF